MMSTGPFALAPGDSQWIMIALIPSVKRDGIDAINRMRADARFLRSLPYDSLITKKPARSVPTNPLPVFDIPASYALFSNYPNPFNAGTTIPFELPERSSVLIEVYDLLGRSVATLAGEIIERGHRTVRWTPLQSTGVYIVRMNATSLESQRSWSGTRKVVLMR